MSPHVNKTPQIVLTCFRTSVRSPIRTLIETLNRNE